MRCALIGIDVVQLERLRAVMKAQTLRDRLSQWETHLAPLSVRQKDGYLQLSTAATSRPLPTQLTQSQVPGKGWQEAAEQMGEVFERNM